VQLAGLDTELADRAQHDHGQKTGPVGVEQRLQGPTDPVVIERRQVAGAEPEQRRVVTTRPLAQTVERLTSQHQVRDHQPDRNRRRQLQAGVLGRHCAREQRGQPKPVQHLVDDRQPTQSA